MHENSKKAFHEIKDGLGPKQQEALEAVRRYGPGTATEIEDKARKGGYTGTGFWKRFSELKALGKIVEGISRPCLITGKTAGVLSIPAAQPQNDLFGGITNPYGR